MKGEEVVCCHADPTICHDCEHATPHIREGAPGYGWCTEWTYCNATGQMVRCTRAEGES